MNRKYALGGAILVFTLAAVACDIGTPVPSIAPSIGLSSPTTGGPTPESATALPTATHEAAPIPSETVTLAPAHPYAVVLVAGGGTLDAHITAGDGSPVAGSLPWDAVDLHSTGNVATVGADPWIELNLPGGGNGWVNRKNLTEYLLSAEFCADSRVAALFASLYEALRSNDGRLLTPIVSPVHGLAVIYIHNGNPKVYSPTDAGTIFGSSEAVDWGLGPGSGLPFQGTFENIVRPDLLTVFGVSYETHCNTIVLGGASYTVTWPSQWKNVNYYSVYKPGSPGTEMDWMTWLAGVEYVDGVPYLFSLSRYNWEP